MNFPFDNLGNDNLGLGATPSRVTSSYSDKTLLSFFARANYNYNNRYLFTATMRADGSTVFSNKHKWGILPVIQCSLARIRRKVHEKPALDLKHESPLRLGYRW